MLRVIAVLLTFGAGTYYGLQSAVIASCLFIWNDIFRPTEWAYHQGPLGSSAWMPVHFATAVLGLSLVLTKWERRWNAAATSILVALAWVFICSFTAQVKEVAFDRAYMTAKYMIPLALISASLVNRRAQLLFLYTLTASVGVPMAFHGIICAMGGPEIHMSIRGGQMTDRNDFMVAGTGCLPMIAFVAWHYGWRFKFWIRQIAKVSLVLAVIALFLSLSRGAVVGFGMLLMYWAFLTGRLFKKATLGIILAVGIFSLLPKVVFERMNTIELEGEQTEGSARNRLIHMTTAVEVTLDYPLTGIGPDNFPIIGSRLTVFAAEPHSLWLKCSSEYGLPMVIFFILLVATMMRRLRREAKLARIEGDRETEGLATALNCALFGFLATGTFTSQFLSEYMWAIIGLIGAFLATPKVQAVEGELEAGTPPETVKVAATAGPSR